MHATQAIAMRVIAINSELECVNSVSNSYEGHSGQ